MPAPLENGITAGGTGMVAAVLAQCPALTFLDLSCGWICSVIARPCQLPGASQFLSVEQETLLSYFFNFKSLCSALISFCFYVLHSSKLKISASSNAICGHDVDFFFVL
jgi:hypothetical protein